MEGFAPAVVDLAPPPRPHNIPTIPLSSYNISLNLTSILALIPGSGFLWRLRRGALEIPLDASEMPTASAVEEWASQASQIVAAESAKEELPSFPGPWGFFTSGYIVGLFIMAVLLHRLQNVIIPSRLPARRARHTSRFGPTFAGPFRHTMLLQRLYASILPLNFARTTTRLVLHLPSVYFLSKMLFVWIILVLQTCDYFPVGQQAGWVDRLGKWSSQKDMTEICWSTFCAVCGAFLVEGFVKALDGLGGGFPMGNVNTSTSPFNLVGYAFLLHIYSSPIAHSFHPTDGSPSRPDKHVIITITIPLLQLTLFHLLSISKRFSTHRLLPTALTSVLSLAHFHLTLYSHFNKPPPSLLHVAPSPTVTAKAAATQRPPSYIGAPSSSYPLLNYIPNIFETFLISTILLTVFINALVQLLVRGRIDRVFSGLGLPNAQNDDETATGFFQSLPFEEDFGVLLLRVGTASLEATGLRGWGNEVAPINRPRVLPYKTGTARGVGPADAGTYGRVRMGRLAVGDVLQGSPRSASGLNVYQDFSGAQRRKPVPSTLEKRGLNNDVRTVDLGNAESPDGEGQNMGGPWKRWFGAVRLFLATVWGVMKGLVVFLLERARGRVRVRERAAARKGEIMLRSRRTPERQNGEEGEESESLVEEKRLAKEKEVYQRFLRGEEISDDEDEEDRGSLDLSEDDDDEDTEPFLEEDGEGEGRESEAVELFTDLLRNGSGVPSTPQASTSRTPGSGEMVLAHLMHGSGGASPGPLTRRRWTALMQHDEPMAGRRPGGRPDLDVFDSEQWEPVRGQSIFDSSLDRDAEERDKQKGLQHVCVICTTESREIICWPCRCLSMCDNCREALASRSAPTKHRCPCCRQTVDGYSRIYIP